MPTKKAQMGAACSNTYNRPLGKSSVTVATWRAKGSLTQVVTSKTKNSVVAATYKEFITHVIGNHRTEWQTLVQDKLFWNSLEDEYLERDWPANESKWLGAAAPHPSPCWWQSLTVYRCSDVWGWGPGFDTLCLTFSKIEVFQCSRVREQIRT